MGQKIKPWHQKKPKSHDRNGKRIIPLRAGNDKRIVPLRVREDSDPIDNWDRDEPYED